MRRRELGRYHESGVARAASMRGGLTIVWEANMGPTNVAAIHCNVDVVHQNGFVQLRGRVVSAVEIDGNYRLDIRKDSRSGGATNAIQAGEFHAMPNEPVFVGVSSFNTEAGMRLVAYFTVQAGGESQSCSSEREVSDE